MTQFKKRIKDEGLEKELGALEDTVVEMVNEHHKIFYDIIKKNPHNTRAAILSCVYAPISILMNAFMLMEEEGKDPCTEFPHFLAVYKSYLKNLTGLDTHWKKGNFSTFRAEFDKKYVAEGHHVGERENNN